MAKKAMSEKPVSPEVHDFLSKNGQKGGQKVSRLIALGKETAEKEHIDVEETETEEESVPEAKMEEKTETRRRRSA